MIIKRLLFTAGIILLVYCGLSAQEHRISGFVKDKATGEPMIGASVITLSDLSGTVSNNHGFYSLNLASAITDTLVYSFVGYRRDTLLVNTTVDTVVNVELVAGIELKDIIVYPSGHNSISRSNAGLLHLPVSAYKGLPDLIEKDIIKSVQLFPGIASGSEGQSGIAVRGGGFDQNLFLLDGVPLYHVNHFGNYLSVFDAYAIKDLKLYKGAFPASYGGRLSSVSDIRIIDGNKKDFQGKVSLGLISSSVLIEGPIKKDKTSFIFSFRRFWPDLLLTPLSRSLLEGATVGYSFYDNIFKLSHILSTKDKLYLSFYAGRDSYKTIFEEEYGSSITRATNKTEWGNILLSGKWVHIYSQKLFGEVNVGYTRFNNSTKSNYSYNDYVNQDKEFQEVSQVSGLNDLSLSAYFEYNLANRFLINFGAGAILHHFNPGYSEINSDINGANTNENLLNNSTLRTVESYCFAENEISINNNIDMSLGLRWSAYQSGESFFMHFEPRITTRLTIPDVVSLSLSYNKMQQYIHLIPNNSFGIYTDLWMPSTSLIPSQGSAQYSFGINRYFESSGFDLSMEAYYKSQTNLSTLKEGESMFVGNTLWENKMAVGGSGISRGLEFMIRKNTGKSTGWVSYTLSKTTRQFHEFNNGRAYPFRYDKRHDISVVFKQQISKGIDFSATWVYGSGLPLTLGLAKYRTLSTKDEYLSEGDIFDFGQTAYIYGTKNNLRMGAYHRLDIGVNFHKVKARGIRTWSFNIYNVYNRQNPLFYYLDYPDDEQNQNGASGNMKVYQRSFFPIMPSITFTYKFK